MTEPATELIKLDLPEDKRLSPPNGYQFEDFPQVTVVPITYTSTPMVRADPHLYICPTPNGEWMYVEVGNVRLAFPDREEWSKFMVLGERLWNTHEAKTGYAEEAESEPLIVEVVEEGEHHGTD